MIDSYQMQHRRARLVAGGLAALLFLGAAACADTPVSPAAPPDGLVAAAIAVGGRVQVAPGGANVRTGSTVTSALVGTQPAGALGTVVNGPVVDYSGDGLTRWAVNFDTGPDGWAAEPYITGVAASAPAVASVTVSPATASVATGATVQLSATVKDASGNLLTGSAVTWTSSATAVATVTAAGLVTGVSAGTVTISAASGGKTGSATITVSAPVATPKFMPGDRVQTTGTANVRSGPAASYSQVGTQPSGARGTILGGPVVDTQGDKLTRWNVDFDSGADGWVADEYALLSKIGGTPPPPPPPPPPPGTAQFGHVFVVVEENTNYGSVIGSASMPYLNSLATQYGLATQYYANTHPSIGNYFMLTTGQILTNNDSYTGTVTADNVVRRLVAAGKTWKSYAEDLPSVGYLGLGETGNYASRHNPVVYFSDVRNDPNQAKNVVPFTQLATDIANNALPHYAMIVPNLCNDGHDCGLSTADTWLKTKLAPLFASAQFQQDGLLIIVFDESSNDNTHGGGRIVWVAIGPKAKRGYQSATLYQHQSTLRLTLQGLGVTAYPGAAATAPSMAEFFVP